MRVQPAGRAPSFVAYLCPPLARVMLALCLAASLSACALLPPQDREGSITPELDRITGGQQDAASPGDLMIPGGPDQPPGGEQVTEERDSVEIFRGTGRFFDEQRADRISRLHTGEGDVTLNFENADIKEVVHFILGQLMEENYLIHRDVSGTVTLQTSRPLPRGDVLLTTLESLLRMNGATLVHGDDGVYQVLPREGALRGTSVPRTRAVGPGLNVRIVPLQFIAAAEMVKILEPFLNPDALVRMDPARNLLVLAGSRRELAQWQETIDIFDVDWLQGMSVGIFTLRNADVGEVVAELEQVTAIDSGSPLAGLFHLIPIERLNAILVVTPQPHYLEEAKVWVKRLDRSRDVHRSRLHVYRMQHAKADEVAGLLTEVFGGESRTVGATGREPSLAPGLEAAEIGGESGREGVTERSDQRAGMVTASLGGEDEEGRTGALAGDVRIISDDSNNALLVMASERDYETIVDALRQLDIPPLQVLVDATIVEVSLTDELRYGLQWFFTDSLGSYRGQGILGDSANLARTFPGFNYSIVDSASQVRAVLSALANDSLVNVLSSPSVMVLDNQEALIRVGDQVPVRASETSSLVTDNPVSITNIQYRDTGVSLRVTPRVNAGGMVRLDIEQEVNDVSTTTSSSIDSPTIQQRLIQSSVAVQSGETIVLGGLIRENRSRDVSGVPGLHRLPVFGALFGATSTSVRRTELLVLLTPRVAHDSREARAITEAFRERMKGLESEVRDATQKKKGCGENATEPC